MKQRTYAFFFPAVLILSLLCGFLVDNHSTYAAEGDQTISARIDRLLIEVDELTKEQDQMLKAQDEIIETIRNLKIVSRKK